VGALQNLAAPRLDVALIGQAIGDKVNEAIGGIHRPEVVALVLAVLEVSEFLAAYVHYPKIGSVTAAIVLAPPHHGVTIKSQLASIWRIAARIAPVGGYGCLEAACDRHFVQIGYARIHQSA